MPNFKVGATRLTIYPLTGLVAACAVTSGINAGSAKAALTCTFGNLSSCNAPENNITFSSFNVTGTGYDSTDQISISFINPNLYAISFNFASSGQPAGNNSTGSISFTATAASGFAFLNAQSNSDILNPAASVTTTLSGLPGSLITSGSLVGPNSFNQGVASTNIVSTWAVNATGVLSNFSLGLRTQPAPSPLPILGAASAFGFSRKLRRRIKSST